MFGLLNTTQIYGIQNQQEQLQQQQQQQQDDLNTKSILKPKTYQRSISDEISDAGQTADTYRKLFTRQTTANFLEKFLKSDLLNGGYDTIKNYKNFHNNNNKNSAQVKRHSDPIQGESILSTFNCLHGSYRHSFDGDIYESITTATTTTTPTINGTSIIKNKDFIKQQLSNDMTIKCSKNLLTVETNEIGPATLQNYQKIPESDHDLLTVVTDNAVPSSGASSGEFNCSSDATSTSNNGGGGNSSGNSGSGNSSTSTNLYKRLSFGGSRNSSVKSDTVQTQPTGVIINNSPPVNLNNSVTVKFSDLQRRSSSSSSGDYLTKYECKKGSMITSPIEKSNQLVTDVNLHSHSPERMQRRKFIQLISSYEQQNKQLQRELAKERRRRTEELACVVKSLLCFESKLKSDMITINHRLQQKDVEICRLVRKNQALRKHLNKLKEVEDGVCDEGVVEDSETEAVSLDEKKQLENTDDCLLLEALQCNNCRKQFYDIEVQDNGTQTTGSSKIESGNRNNDEPNSEHGSSSDETVSSSFFGARRSLRYTSKRTSGTFRDYMRSRAMNIDDPALETGDNSEEGVRSVSRADSTTSYDKLHMYSRTMDRLHGVKSESERDSEQSGLETASLSTRSISRASTKSSKSCSSTSKHSDVNNSLEEDDGIFSPTQDEDCDDDEIQSSEKVKTVKGKSREAFSEASPKQIYEISTDDWYASASDPDEIAGTLNSNNYGQGAVNPVLECVNQILLQQSMEVVEEQQVSSTPKSTVTLPRRSSLSDRRNGHCNNQSTSSGGPNNSQNGTLTRKRVHFSTKNSMVHVPRNDEMEEDEDEDEDPDQRDGDEEVLYTTNVISNYQSMANYIRHSPPTLAEEDEDNMALEQTNEKKIENIEHRNSLRNATERLDIFNYESIYSNEYEPIGSEVNSSNLYVDMETTMKGGTDVVCMKNQKLPPALPPKPANLIKFKKSLEQLLESPEEINETPVTIEPDYCSISEVTSGITSVQIRADVHRAPLSEPHLQSIAEAEMDVETVTVISDNASQKTEEIEEIFADIPKLPNVAAIIAPKSALKNLKHNDYLSMNPKVDTKLMPTSSSSAEKADRKDLRLKLDPLITSSPNRKKDIQNNTKLATTTTSTPLNNLQYKRRHGPNIWTEINKRFSLPNSPITPTPILAPATADVTAMQPQKSSFVKISSNDLTTNKCLQNLPLQAEFDWYNLDAEYGRSTAPTDLIEVSDALNSMLISSTSLAEIQEGRESVITVADEYNLDEEYAQEYEPNGQRQKEIPVTDTTTTATVTVTMPSQSNVRAKKIKKNLANFEKFIESSGLSAKPLATCTTKRKIYFSGPFV